MGKKAFRIIFVVLLLGAVGAFCWTHHKSWLARYYAGRLAKSDEGEAAQLAERLAGLGDAAVPPLLDLLRQEAPACKNSGLALARIVDSGSDAQCQLCAQGLHENFSEFSVAGRQVALEAVENLLARSAECQGPCRETVLAALNDEAPAVRQQAIALAMAPEIYSADKVVPLLHDGDASVRRAALLAVGPARDVIADDDLLPCLHDSDADVRRLGEATLLGRGLRPQDIRLGRLITAPEFLKRLEILNYLGSDDELDPQAWLERLSTDDVPAVRAAAVRAAFDTDVKANFDFTARAQQMARNDPDGTVRQIAAEVLRQRGR